MSSRHLSRSIAMQSLYEWDFYGRKGSLKKIVKKNMENFGPGLKDKSFVHELTEGVEKFIKELDRIIQKAAPQWPIEQIAFVDRNVLRLGLYELLYGNKKAVPPKVAINEAIELAKSFGGGASGRFVNGVLGTIFKEIPRTEKKEKPTKSEELPQEILSSGLVYRRKDKNYQIALIYDIFGYWTFPKGHVEEKETLTQALLREIAEEIGLKELKIIKELGQREYLARDPEKGRIRKKVTDFLVEASGNTQLKVEESPGIKDAKWFNLDEIPKLRQYKEAKKILQDTINHFEE